jgi:ABC-type transport system substrate-binding protein
MTKRPGCLRLYAAFAVLVALATSGEAKTFRWANDGDPTTMDPQARSDLFVSSFDFNMYEALVRRDRNLRLEPALATEWANINPTTWRFKLRHAVTFHDGTPLTVEDVLFSYQRAVAPGSDLIAQLSAVKEVKKIDEDTVDFITDGPAPILPNYLASIAIMSKAWCAAHNTLRAATLKDEESYATRNANGTGPFMLKDRQPMVRTVLAKTRTGGASRTSQSTSTRSCSAASRTRQPGCPPCWRATLTWSTTCRRKTSSRLRRTQRSRSGRLPSCGRCSSAWTRAATSFWNPM